MALFVGILGHDPETGKSTLKMSSHALEDLIVLARKQYPCNYYNVKVNLKKKKKSMQST